jgi:hypothetical protein
MMRLVLGLIACFAAVWICPTITVLAGDVDTHSQTMLEVQQEGVGHAAAVSALKNLAQQPSTALIPLLSGMDHANPLAANWLRGAFETIADRTLKKGSLLPKQELEEFTLDGTHASQSRQLAFDWLVRVDPSATDRLIPGMLDDPSTEFRRAVVQRLIDAAAKAGKSMHADESREIYRRAFRAARDPDQLDLVFEELTRLGEKPDLNRQLGMLDTWWLQAFVEVRGYKMTPNKQELCHTTWYRLSQSLDSPIAFWQ